MSNEEDATTNAADGIAALAELNEQVLPMIEAAEGIRGQLEARGWTPESAEAAAAVHLKGLLGYMWATVISELSK